MPFPGAPKGALVQMRTPVEIVVSQAFAFGNLLITMMKTIFFLFLIGVGLVVYLIKSDHIDVKELILKVTETTAESGDSTGETEGSTFFPSFGNSRDKFPLERTVTDTRGRPLEGTILGKSNGSIAMKRSSDDKEFVIVLSKLSEADQKFFSEMADYKPVLLKPNKMEGRVARWNSDSNSAQKEAIKFGLPIYLVFTGTSWCPPCQSMERLVFSSSAFRDFANQNVVLMKITVPGSRRLTGFDQQLSDQYGISSYPTILLLDDTGKEFYKHSGASIDPERHTTKMKKLIASKE